MKDEKQGSLRHVAIIMDGNGRWAQAQGLPRALGHRAGMESLKKIVEACPDLGIDYLTVYAFSTENWKRPKLEVEALMRLMSEYIDSELSRLKKNGVRIKILGDILPVPAALRSKIENAVMETANNQGLTFSIALNYGGRQEILQAAKRLAHQALQGEDPDQWTEEDFQKSLYIGDLPDPDLMIRTGGELRISNFLLWQLAYSELWTTPIYWPDFTPDVLAQALHDYGSRQRRFGGI